MLVLCPSRHLQQSVATLHLKGWKKNTCLPFRNLEGAPTCPWHWNKWMFPKIGVPQNGWFIMENLIKMDDLGVPLFSETSISKRNMYSSFFQRLIGPNYQTCNVHHGNSIKEFLIAFPGKKCFTNQQFFEMSHKKTLPFHCTSWLFKNGILISWFMNVYEVIPM